MKCLGFVVFFLTTSVLADLPDQEAPPTAWLKALQYEEGFFGYQSLAQGPRFFVHPLGRTHPSLELQATLDLLSHSELQESWRKKFGQDFQCTFPFRMRVIEQITQKVSPRPSCSSFKIWRSTFRDVLSVSLVFASQYLSNPASVMGHTFLRFNTGRSLEQKRLDLLDFSVGYAAQIPDDIGTLNYIYSGLLGGFKGVFHISPYYQKVAEYNHFESRDIWDYELTLSQTEVELLLEHLFELIYSADYDYFFTSKNCSYLPLAAIDSVFAYEGKMRESLLESFLLYVLPHETLKRVYDQGLVRAIQFRPSQRRVLRNSYEKLTFSEKNTFFDLLEDNTSQVEETNNLILDTAIQAVEFERFAQKGTLSPERESLRKKLLKKSPLPIHPT